MSDQVIQRALDAIRAIDSACDDPATTDAEFERLLAVRTFLCSDTVAVAARGSNDPNLLRVIERRTRDAQWVLDSVRRSATSP